MSETPPERPDAPVTIPEGADRPIRCSNCYTSFSGPWCDACGTWPCLASTCGHLVE